MINNKIKKTKLLILFTLIILGSLSGMNRVSAMESSDSNENSRRGIVIKPTEYLEQLRDKNLTVANFPKLLGKIVESCNSNPSKYAHIIKIAAAEIQLHEKNTDWAEKSTPLHFIAADKNDKNDKGQGSRQGSIVRDKLIDALEAIKDADEKNNNS